MVHLPGYPEVTTMRGRQETASHDVTGGRTRQANRSAERWRAWRSGLLLQVRIYAVVAALLVLAAIYEGIEVIWVLSRLTPLA